MSYVVVPLAEQIATAVRRTGRAPGYGHPVHAEIATGSGPCRSCLRFFEKGIERRLLFTYDAFQGVESLPLPGPVFVHEDHCAPYPTPERFPDALRSMPLTLNGYAKGRQLREVARVEPDGALDEAIERLFARPDVDYLHVRNTEAGCYVCRLDRVPTSSPA